LIKWNFVHNGDAQYKYQVKIFDMAVVSGGGFDPETSLDVYDSDWITSSASQHQVPPEAALDPFSTYAVYVRTSKNMNFQGTSGRSEYVGPWAISHIRTNSPPTPAIIPHLDVALGLTTRRPFLGMQYADPEGDGMRGAETKVFTDAVHDAGGFDPDTSDAISESGQMVYGDPELLQHPTNLHAFYWRPERLDNGTYHQYSRMQQLDGLWSDWISDEWIQDVVLVKPEPPLFSALPDPDNARVILFLQRDPAGVQPDFFSIERQSPLNGIWEPVRAWNPFLEIVHPNLDHLPYTGSDLFTFYDYEALPNRVYTYRAVLYDTTTLDDEPSDPTEYSGILKQKKVWFKDLDNPENNLSFPVRDTWLSRSHPKERSVRRGLDRKKPVVVRGEGEGEAFTMTFTIIGNDRYEALRNLVDANKTMFLQTSKTQWHVDIQSATFEEHLWDELHEEPEGGAWYVTCQFLEVEY
jgi:hypothetical protein